MMRILQLAMLGLFAVFAVLTFFFQVRTGMKDGQQARGEQPQDAAKFSRLTHVCAALAAVFLVLCMAVGAVSRLGM